MRFGIIFGGSSYEHEISIVSAIAVRARLGEGEFIYLDGDGDFYLIDEIKASIFMDGSYKSSKQLFLSKHGFRAKKLFGFEELKFDRVINLVHGAQGEDGELAGLLDFYSIPYIGPRKEACVLSFNKHLSKLFARELGIKTLEYQILESSLKLPLPVILKPLRGGSSIGISIVKDERELAYAKDSALEYDDRVLAEPFISGVREYNLAGIRVKNKAKSYFELSLIEEPKKKEFLSFENKYLDFSRSGTLEQAQIAEELREKLERTFIKLYDAGGFHGALIRCDFFVIEGEVYLNEINPVPGSLANYLFADFKKALEHAYLPERSSIKPSFAYLDRVKKAK